MAYLMVTAIIIINRQPDRPTCSTASSIRGSAMTDPPIGLEKAARRAGQRPRAPGGLRAVSSTPTVDAGARAQDGAVSGRTRRTRFPCATGWQWEVSSGLILLFAAGIFANYLAPYPVDQIDLTRGARRADDGGTSLPRGPTRSGRDFLSRIIFGNPYLGGGSASSSLSSPRSSGSSSEHWPASTADSSTTSSCASPTSP